MSYKPPTFKKCYIGVFAKLLGCHGDSSFATSKYVCIEITRKVSDPTSCHGAVNVVLTHILDPT